MNAVYDDVGSHGVVAENFADDPRAAMIQRTHGIESMRRMASAGLHRRTCHGELCIRVSNAHANLSASGFCDHFHCAGNLRGNRYHAHMAAGRLPQLFENWNGGFYQVLRRGNSAPLMAQKWSFEMNPQRPPWGRVSVNFRHLLDRTRQPLQSRASCVEWSGHGRREISGYAMRDKEPT